MAYEEPTIEVVATDDVDVITASDAPYSGPELS